MLCADLTGYRFIKSRSCLEQRTQGRICRVQIDVLSKFSPRVTVSVFYGVWLEPVGSIKSQLGLPDGAYHVNSGSIRGGRSWTANLPTEASTLQSPLSEEITSFALPFLDAHRTVMDVWQSCVSQPSLRPDWQTLCVLAHLVGERPAALPLIPSTTERLLAEELLERLSVLA